MTEKWYLPSNGLDHNTRSINLIWGCFYEEQPHFF
jgi:hypothetical protein